MNFDQYEEPTDEQVKLARAAEMLSEALIDEEGNVIDLADKEGRERLQNALRSIPKTIPAKLDSQDRELMKEVGREVERLNNRIWLSIWTTAGCIILSALSIFLGYRWYKAADHASNLEKDVYWATKFIQQNQALWDDFVKQQNTADLTESE